MEVISGWFQRCLVINFLQHPHTSLQFPSSTMNTGGDYSSDEERNTKYAVFHIQWKSPQSLKSITRNWLVMTKKSTNNSLLERVWLFGY